MLLNNLHTTVVSVSIFSFRILPKYPHYSTVESSAHPVRGYVTFVVAKEPPIN